MNTVSTAAVLLAIIFDSMGCGTDPMNNVNETAAIRNLLRQEQKAHLEKNDSLFIDEFAPGMVSVNRGMVTVSSTDEHRTRIRNYFQSVDFVQWDDRVAPKIYLSDDGSLAYAIVEKTVVLREKTSPVNLDTTHFAWVSILRKYDGKWKVECNVSTNR
jgi:hypothetical protein